MRVRKCKAAGAVGGSDEEEEEEEEGVDGDEGGELGGGVRGEAGEEGDSSFWRGEWGRRNEREGVLRGIFSFNAESCECGVREGLKMGWVVRLVFGQNSRYVDLIFVIDYKRRGTTCRSAG
jgi:hypothetical protein